MKPDFDPYEMFIPEPAIQPGTMADGFYSREQMLTFAKQIADDRAGDLMRKIEVAATSLLTIEKWALPTAIGRDYTLVNQGKAVEPRLYPSTYELEHGSNGAREYMRKVAREALQRLEVLA